MARTFALAWPLILANITVPLLGLVDTLVLGHLDSPVYLGAVAVASNIFGLIYVSLNFLRTSTVGLTAQALGQDQENHRKQEKVLYQGLLISFVLGLFLLLFNSLYLPRLLQIMMSSDSVYSHALLYANIRILSAPAVLAIYVVIGWLIGLQQTRGALIILTLTNAINMVLDVLLVSVFDFNVKGVAWATVIADYSGCICALFLASQQLQAKKFRLNKKALAQLFNKVDFYRLFSINSNLFIRTLALLSVFAFFTAQGARQGDALLAANAILLNFLFLISNTLDGFANAAESTTGHAWGSKNKTLFYRQCLSAFIWFFIITFLLMLIFSLGGALLISILTSIDTIKYTAIEYLPWLILMPLVSSWSYLFDGIFTGTTAIKEMRNTILLPGIIIYLPAWWVFQFMNNHGLWLAMILFMLARSLLGLYYFLRYSTYPHWGSLS